MFFHVCHLSRISSSCCIQTHQRKKLLLRSMQFQQCRKGPFAKVPSINDVATCMTPTLPWLFFYLLWLDNLLKTTWFLIKFKYSEKAIKFDEISKSYLKLTFPLSLRRCCLWMVTKASIDSRRLLAFPMQRLLQGL